MSDVAIHVDSVSKAFKLPNEKHGSLKSALLNLFGSKSYERQQVLDDVSFSIKTGEFFGIVGKNGGGKSTLLKLLANIYVPDSGGISTTGKLVPFIELGVGFNPELSGRDNVYLNGAMLGFSDREIDDMYDDIVAFAELEKFMDQKLKNYSSGMQVRLAFSVATRAKADILLVDEVLAVGDASFQRKCYNYFSSLKKQGKTVIFISHDMDAVREYCDRVILIDGGRVVKSGSASEIAEAYNKLFSDQATDTAEQSRWGSGAIELSVKDTKVDESNIELEVEVRAKEAVGDLVVGVSIKAEDGRIVYGTNTQLLKKPLKAMKSDEVMKLSWTLPNVLRDGTYTIDLASHGYGGLPVYDWWNDAVTVKSAYNRKSPYAVSPAVELKVK